MSKNKCGCLVRAAALATVGFSWLGAPARAGNVPENALLIINPENADSLYVGNYYKQARNIPDRNVLYMKPDPASWTDFLAFQRPAFTGMLVNRMMDDHIDYVIIPPGGGYRMTVPSGLIIDGCSPVTRFSVSAAYTMAQISSTIVPGTSVTTVNQYYSPLVTLIGFDANTYFQGGAVGSPPLGRRYYIGGLLGYSGANGNTIAQTLEMIDRAVAADGSFHPTPGAPPPLPGTFYYVETNDPLRSDPRDGFFNAAVSSLATVGFVAVHLGDGNQPIVLPPPGTNDIAGCMTGAAVLPLASTPLTIRPGAFCDHLTSYAATFDDTSQTKVSEWITKGAAGSVGAVEEPCNYPGKFPHARLHVYYGQGSTLGEAAFRSLAYVPFQMLLYGDPLTRPFAFIPEVSVPDAPDPSVPVSGNLLLTPSGTTAQPVPTGVTVNWFELHIDGVLASSTSPPNPMSVNTAALPDGPHDFRMLGRDSTPATRWGRSIFTVRTDNFGRSVTAVPVTTSGTRATDFYFDISASGGAVAEIRLMQNQRVLAAAAGQADVTLPVRGATLGAGASHLQAVAEFTDGKLAVSDPIVIQVSPGATGDVDGDGDIDLTDYSTFAGCLAGPDVMPLPTCLPNLALDSDQDVDLADAALFFAGFAGTAPLAPPTAFGYTFQLAPGGRPALVELPAFDARGAALTYTVLSNPAQALVSGTGPYRLVTPNNGASGTDTMTFRVTAAGLDSNVATITLTY